MLVLALDTTTRHGSAALARNGVVFDCEVGDPSLTHAQRLPGDLMRLLERNAMGVADIDLFAVAAGPGSFTGIRLGIATMQGLALVGGRPLAGVSALDALNAGDDEIAGRFPADPALTAVWIDAQRGQVFSALYEGERLIEDPHVDTPAGTLQRWIAGVLAGAQPVRFVGDGALVYAAQILEAVPRAAVAERVPPLAPALARLAAAQAARGGDLSPDAIRAIYVRRPDVELARERAAGTPTA